MEDVIKKVLIVDDSPIARHFHANILKMNDWEILEAKDGMEALEIALRNDIDLILCDINMDGMDGISFVQRYREVEPKIPIILISTQKNEVELQKGVQFGANSYITKPVTPEKLLEMIEKLGK